MTLTEWVTTGMRSLHRHSVTALDPSSVGAHKQGRFLYTYMKRVTTTLTTTDTSFVGSVSVSFYIQCTVDGVNLINLPNCPA